MYCFLSTFSFIESCFTSAVILKFLAIFVLGKQKISFPACFIQAFVFLFLGAAGFLLIAVMSLDQYLAICKPLHYLTIMNLRTCFLLVTVCFALGFTLITGPVKVSQLPFCDLGPLTHLSCSDTRSVKMYFSFLTAGFLLIAVMSLDQYLAICKPLHYLTIMNLRTCFLLVTVCFALGFTLITGPVDSYDVTVDEELGDIQLIKIEKRKYWLHDDWYLKYITLKTPCGDYIEFPCYRWISGEGEIVLRDGRAKLACDDQIHILKQHRRKELETRQKLYRWMEWNPGFPLSIDAKCHRDLPRDIQFDSEKGVDFVLNYSKAMENLFINRFMHMFQSSWNDFADFEKIFVKISNTISERVMNHWQEDVMFGYQFLNGCNPVLIQRCRKLPEKLPVTTEMVECSLERQLTLEQEVEQGNIFIVDFELLDGIDANKTDPCTLQFLAAPICLLYKNLANKIVPIAIQLSQVPGDENPIFLPSDAKYDWLLAKIWVRSSDFHIHQTITHLLCTHLVSEVFGIAMYRQLPAVHPIFKLLVAHVRFTIAINTKAREQLICEYGLFDKLPPSLHTPLHFSPSQQIQQRLLPVTASLAGLPLAFSKFSVPPTPPHGTQANATGGGGHVQMVQKAMQNLTYSSLCFPEAIKARGMDSTEDIPYYFYRDDGLLVWEAIKTFTAEVVDIYYESDQVVEEDLELQDFVNDVYVYGMRGRKASVPAAGARAPWGPMPTSFPKSIKTKKKLSEYLTVVIFTASAQHAAVNFGQYDWCSWIPNAPPTMRAPPPTTKGVVTIEQIVDTLPDRGRSCWHLGAVWALSQFQDNELFLGMYPEEHFIEKPVKEAMARFRKNLDAIVSVIAERNKKKKLPYYYLSPDRIPNSVAI
ncbi:Arachidonate 5-lipoxygenase-like protein [Camelus ferus]|nr:Arachidonate 5-lipoxygenase-like protein [Camelus ferus]